MSSDVELELRSLIAAYERVLTDRGINDGDVFETRIAKRLGELRSKLFDMQQAEAARKMFAARCCENDTDGDGNCTLHESPGVLRKRFRHLAGLK